MVCNNKMLEADERRQYSLESQRCTCFELGGGKLAPCQLSLKEATPMFQFQNIRTETRRAHTSWCDEWYLHLYRTHALCKYGITRSHKDKHNQSTAHRHTGAAQFKARKNYRSCFVVRVKAVCKARFYTSTGIWIAGSM